LEFFGDEIETIRRFDPTTQRTFASSSKEIKDVIAPDQILVSPAREYILPAHLAPTPGDAAEQHVFLDAAREFTEFNIPSLHTTPASLLDYLPDGSLILVDDFLALEEMVAEIEEQAVKLRQDLIAHQTLSDDFPVPYLTWSELDDCLTQNHVTELGPSAGGDDEKAPQPAVLADRFAPGPRFGGRLKPTMDYLVDRYHSNGRVFIVSRQAARLRELWSDQHPATTSSAHPATEALNEPVFIEGSLGEGWVFTDQWDYLLELLTDGEIFGWRRPKPRHRHAERYPVAAEDPEAGYSDLEIGGYVVHVDHGIGRFIGLTRRTVDNLEREYICVEYADESQLFVPVYQADRLMRYVGADNRTPTLSRLGSSEWRNTKSDVKEAVQEVAQDLLELYARRSIVQGYQFGKDTPWQEELEASFPYIETDDQMRVIGEVKRDMESPRPMDRLICGDVGYGKTEVALRAAFKAVNDGRQVAVLVPTTVLAQQHYHTFRERLAAFPVEVEMLSRFRNQQQQRNILEQMDVGKIDIVIGTHRLLSTDVAFKDLGLLIIDEEQRFGVTHKEALKKMRTEVDVLTLTATPIPRTLYMALSGVRDISTINTPPEERLPIITHVGPYSQAIVRQAILRELERGGQVFFVHNRVQTIRAMLHHLEQLVPEARITIAHGQMEESELSHRMDLFTNGDVDILLCTTIIESGLDIPNANTLIVDRADAFGLAQLYQLRGRVGRGAQRAYAYFFRHKRKPPTEEGRQRLETIAENTQLGAGFSIAMRDLEIRGAGDILGARQHGHIAAVGFHLYTRLLSEAVRSLRSDRSMPDLGLLTALQIIPPSVNVELPLPTGIPSDYVPDKNTRLGLYRRIAGLRAIPEIDALMEEFNDRFGAPPDLVCNLLFQLRIKLLAEKAGVMSVTSEANQIVLRYPEGMMPATFPDLGGYIRVGKVALWMPYTNLPDWQAKVTEVVSLLAA
jgi:transcription-repair coupling factor (superfamily II helicase)